MTEMHDMNHKQMNLVFESICFITVVHLLQQIHFIISENTVNTSEIFECKQNTFFNITVKRKETVNTRLFDLDDSVESIQVI